MSNLYLYNYNNYFNRIVKKESTLADYGAPIYSLMNTNFDMNDSVTSSHTINYPNFDGDYVIITDNENNITSHWFVMENKKQRGGQHTLYLRRDLIVDNYDKVINAPCLINRAMIKDVNNPLLFNSEGFSFNQIKKEELLLKQKGFSTYFYALYFAKNTPAKSKSLIIKPETYDFTINQPIAQSIYATATHTKMTNPSMSLWWIEDMHWYSDTPSKAKQTHITRVYSDSDISTQYPVTIDRTEVDDVLWIVEENVTSKIEGALQNHYADIVNAIRTERNLTETNLTDSQLNEIINANGKVVYDSTGHKYKISVQYSYSSGISFYSQEDSTLSSLVEGYIQNTPGLEIWGDFGDMAVMGHYALRTVSVSYTEIASTEESIDWSIDFTNMVNTKAPYNIILIPANNGAVKYTEKGTIGEETIYTDRTRNLDEETNKLMLDSIIAEYGTQYIYDVQIIPYYDDINRIEQFGDYIDLTYRELSDSEFNKEFYIDSISSKNIAWFIHYLRNISFTFNTNLPLSSFREATSDMSAIDKKVFSETTLYRLVSPNFNGIFEFNPVKNGGINYINVDVTLRPYNPYIHVNPDFKELYGSDFDDARGLICQGDFSLPLITDQFKTYEVNNKNYQNIFNRQIEHMDFEYGLQRAEAIFGATVGSIGAGVSGGLVGGKVGGIGGAVAGAIGGTVASAIGGAVDYNILKQRQAENKDLMIDNFKYQLGNIKALPFTINKIDPFTKNNKIWPILEIYSSTEQEKILLRNYLSYKSMTINAIGSIGEYIQDEKTYISGSLIRLEGLDCQMHEAQEIYDEIMKGVFI